MPAARLAFAALVGLTRAWARALAEREFPLSTVRFVGRWYAQGAEMRHAWGPGAFEVRFRGSTRVGAVLRNPSELYHVCSLDGGLERRLAHAAGTLWIASGLSAADEHVVRCGRSNEASLGETALSAIVLDSGAEALQPPGPADAELRLEAIGDSITAGFAVYEGPGSSQGATTENCDVYQTYARHLADAWATSEWHVIARSGISVTQYDAGTKVMQQRWPCRTWSWGSCPGAWDFSSWQADVVTINLGTNDYAFGNPSAADFQAAYAELISLVRSRYPDALILCLAPLVYSCFGNDPKWQSAVASIERAVHGFQQSGDERVQYHATGTLDAPWLVCAEDYSDYTHPTAGGNRKFAERLLESLTPEVRRFFPQKCGGTGARCQGAPAAPAAPPAPPASTAPSPSPQPLPATSTPAPGVETTRAPVHVPGSGPNPQPTPSTGQEGCAKAEYAQCGGEGFTGDACCPAGMWCMPTGEWWSHCQPCEHTWDTSCEEGGAPGPQEPPAPAPPTEPAGAACAGEWQQCGGQGWQGPTCCAAGLQCSILTEWWSQCNPISGAALPQASQASARRLPEAAVEVAVGRHGFLAQARQASVGAALLQRSSAVARREACPAEAWDEGERAREEAVAGDLYSEL